MAIVIRHYQKALWAIASSGYSKKLHQCAKLVPGMRWEPAAEAWVGYPDAVALCAEHLRANGIRLVEWQALPEPGAIPPATMLIKEKDLRDYQRLGVRWLIAHAEEGCLLADGMRLGKTAQFLRTARALKLPALAVCPGFVKGVWSREATKWWPEAKVVTLYGTKPKDKDIAELATADLIVCNYQILQAWAPYLIDAGVAKTVGLDECHMLQGERSQRSAAARSLCRAARYRIALSGTPMLNRPKDLYNIIDTISEGRFGLKAFPFFLRYCDAKQVQITRERTVWEFDGTSHLDELHDRLRYFMLRRTAKDVAAELPPLTRQVLDVEVTKGCMLAPASALQNDKAMRRALDLASDGKVPDVIALIRSHLAEGMKVVCFTHRRVIAETIVNELEGRASLVHGGIPQKKRDAIIAEEPDVLVCTMDSTGVGIDLSYADVAVFAELDWVPSKLLQCEARLFNFAKPKPLFVQYVIGVGTVDELIRHGVLDKLRSAERVVGKHDDQLEKNLNDIEKGGVAALMSLYESLEGIEQ